MRLVCTREGERNESLEMVRELAAFNGYSLRIPSGLANSAAVVDLPPDNLRTQLVRNRLYDRCCGTPDCVAYPTGKKGHCTVSSVLNHCQAYVQEYIGETVRPLHVRIKQHLYGKEKLIHCSRLP